MVSEEDAAATKLASIQKGKNDRKAIAFKKSKIWQALGRSDAAGLTAALVSASASEMTLCDDLDRTPLRAAIDSGNYACVKALICQDGALGLPAAELTAWQRVQAAKKGPENEDDDPVDPTDPEWQKALAEELFPEEEPIDREGKVKCIVQLGLYAGGRADRDPDAEPEFDTEVTPRLGFGACLSAGGDVYVGFYGTGGLREGAGALRSATGAIYVGQWLEGQRHGAVRLRPSPPPSRSRPGAPRPPHRAPRAHALTLRPSSPTSPPLPAFTTPSPPRPSRDRWATPTAGSTLVTGRTASATAVATLRSPTATRTRASGTPARSTAPGGTSRPASAACTKALGRMAS